MKKISIFIAAVLLVSTVANAQLGGLLKKKNNGGGDAGGGKEQLVADEPGTIFGNYYFKFMPEKGADEGYMQTIKNYFPKDGKTMQLQRYEAGKDNIIVLSWGGAPKQEYTYNEDLCGGCEKLNKAGFVSYLGFSSYHVGGRTEQTESFMQWGITDFGDGVLQSNFFVLSKDKSKVENYTQELLEQKMQASIARRKELLSSLDKGEKMPQAGAALKAPVFAAANKAAVTQLKAKLDEMGYSYLVPVYAYEMNGTPTFSPKYNNSNEQVARTAGFYVVCKNTKIASANAAQKFEYKTKYVVFTIDMKEDGSGASFSGKPYLYQPVFGGKAIDDAENAMKYK